MCNRDELYGPAKAVFKWKVKQVRFSHLIDDSKGKCHEDGIDEPIFKLHPSIVLCEDIHSESHPSGQEIVPADFWDYLYSKSWGKDCSLRIMDGQLLEMILTTLLVLERDQVVGMHNSYCYTTTTRRHPVCYRETEKNKQLNELLLVDFTYYGIRSCSPVPNNESKPFLPDINASTSGSLDSVQQFTRTSPERFICREPRSVKHDGDVECLDSGLLGIKGPIRKFPLWAIDRTIPSDQSAAALVRLFGTDRHEILHPVFKKPGASPVTKQKTKGGDKTPEMLEFHLATKTIEHGNIGWDLDRCTNTRRAQGDMVYVTDEPLPKNTPEKAEARLKKLLSLKEENRRLKPRERTAFMKRNTLSIDYTEIKRYTRPIIKPFSQPPSFVEYIRYLEIQDYLKQKSKKGKGKNKKRKKRWTPSMPPNDSDEDEYCTGFSGKSAGKAQRKTGVPHRKNIGAAHEKTDIARRKSGLRVKTNAAFGSTTDVQNTGGKIANLTAGETPEDDAGPVQITIIEASKRRFAEEVGGVADSVATKNSLLDLYTHPLEMNESEEVVNLSQQQSYLSTNAGIKEDTKTGKSIKTNKVHLEARRTHTLEDRGMHAHGMNVREIHARGNDQKTHARGSQRHNVHKMQSSGSHRYEVNAHNMHTQGMKMLIGTDKQPKNSHLEDILSVLSSHLGSSQFSQSTPPSSISNAGSYFELFDTSKLNQQYSYEKFGVKSRKEIRLELIHKLHESKSKKISEISSPPSEELVHEPTPEPEISVLGKLKKLAFLQYRNYEPKIPEISLPDFSTYPVQDFVHKLLHALDDFIVRKEIISSSYEKRTLTTVTFTRHEIFVDSLSKLKS